MRDGKELEWHPQGSGKPIDFGIGRKLISASSFDRRSNPMPDRSASSVTLRPRSSRHTVSGGLSSNRRWRAFYVISAMSQLRKQRRMINRSRLLPNDLIASHSRRKMAGKCCYSLSSPMGSWC